MSMMPVFPEVLKKHKDQWAFSEEEPWKPVAKDGSSDEVKRAIEEFLSTVDGKPVE